LPAQTLPSSGAAKKVFWASASVITSAGTSSRLAAKLHVQDGGISTMSWAS
jgi:hypothetical protein